MEGIRQRKRHDEDKTCSGDTGNSDVGERKESAKTSRLDDSGSNSYWLTRIVFLRSLSFVYCKFCQSTCSTEWKAISLKHVFFRE